jgi:hypothetical protein
MTTEMKGKCRICGHEGSDVSPGLYRTSKGKFVAVDKCNDRKACDARKAAL